MMNSRHLIPSVARAVLPALFVVCAMSAGAVKADEAVARPGRQRADTPRTRRSQAASRPAWQRSADQAEPDPNVAAYAYKKIPQGELKIYVHSPTDVKEGERRPAIVFFFGGGWRNGTAEQFRRQAAYFATRGMVAARADYRVQSRQGVMPDKCVEDAKSAVRWLRQNAARLHIDPDRIVAAGGSAGGHLAACTGMIPGFDVEGEDLTVSSKPNALILFNPVLSMEHPRIVERLNGDEELAKKISPTRHLDKGAPPTLILFGSEDKLIAQADPFLEKAKQLGLRAEMLTAPGEKHGFFNRSPWYERTLRRADEFLIAIGYLRGEPTIKADEVQASASRPARGNE